MSDTEDHPKKKSKEKPIQYWILRVLAVLIPAFFSYCQAKSEAESEARAIAKKQAGQVEDVAGAGYQEMVKAVQHLDQELMEYRKDLYSMQGHIEALEDKVNGTVGTHVRFPRPPPHDTHPDAGVGSAEWSANAGSAAGSAAAGSGSGEPDHDYPAPPERNPLDVAPDLGKAAAKHGVPQAM